MPDIDSHHPHVCRMNLCWTPQLTSPTLHGSSQEVNALSARMCFETWGFARHMDNVNELDGQREPIGWMASGLVCSPLKRTYEMTSINVHAVGKHLQKDSRYARQTEQFLGRVPTSLSEPMMIRDTSRPPCKST